MKVYYYCEVPTDEPERGSVSKHFGVLPGPARTKNIYQIYLSATSGLTFLHFYELILREKVARKKQNISQIKERISFLDEANMTKFVLNYLKVYEPGKYFPRRQFGKQARRKKAELRFLVNDDMDVQYDQRTSDNLFIFR